MNRIQTEGKTYRERALGVYKLLEDERKQTMALLAAMTPEQRLFKPDDDCSALQAFFSLLDFQKKFSRVVLMMSWFRPLFVKLSNKAERETISDPYDSPPLKKKCPAPPITDWNQLELREKHITRTLRQRLNCFEHNEWLIISLYSLAAKRSLTFVQWVWLLIFRERIVRDYISKLPARPGYPPSISKA